MGFQQHVYYQPAPAVEGDFASANPRASVLAGPGSLVAGPVGVTVGRFAWATSAGLPVTLHQAGDFWVRNAGAAPSAAGQKAFANLADGTVTTGAAGAAVTGAVETKWAVMSAAAPGELMKISTWPLG